MSSGRLFESWAVKTCSAYRRERQEWISLFSWLEEETRDVQEEDEEGGATQCLSRVHPTPT